MGSASIDRKSLALSIMRRSDGCHSKLLLALRLWIVIVLLLWGVSAAEEEEGSFSTTPTAATTTTATTTYVLQYDGYFHDIHNKQDNDENVISDSLVENVSTEIASDMAQLYRVKTTTNSLKKSGGISGKTIDLERRCYRSGDAAVRCALDHYFDYYNDSKENNGHPRDYYHVAFHLDTHFYLQEGHELVRLDASITTTTTTTTSMTTTTKNPGAGTILASNVLTELIPYIHRQLNMKDDDEAVWSIQHRPSFLDMRQQGPKKQKTWVAQVQHAKEAREASLEQVIHSQSNLIDRRRLDATMLDGHDLQVWEYRQAFGSTKTSLLRSLFIDGMLRATSSSSSFVSAHTLSTVAHAEALIHPAMVAHVSPKRIALWSSTPPPLVREILKHRSVEHLTVLGADPRVIDYINQWLPPFNDCSFRKINQQQHHKSDNEAIDGETTSCMNQAAVEFVYHSSASSWVDRLLLENITEYTSEDYYKGFATNNNNKTNEGCDMSSPFLQPNCHYSQYPQFDIIFIEIPTTAAAIAEEEDWLDINLHKKLSRLLTPESILVINVGSAPSILDTNDFGELSARDNFLYTAGRSVKHGGIGHTYTIVYEEPMSSPLPTTNIACFPDDSWSYARFVQKNNPASLDLDLVAKVYPAATAATPADKSSNTSHHIFRNTPTLVYDGPTHVAYLQTPWIWEYWYCQNPKLGGLTWACQSFLNQWYNASYHHLTSTEVRRVPVKGRTIFTTKPIPKGHFVISHDTALNLRIDRIRWYALEKFVKDFPDAKMYDQIREFYDAYGYESEAGGLTGWGVSMACNATFVNHGCNEQEINLDWMKRLYDNVDGEYTQSTILQSRRAEVAAVLAQTTRDIQAGEEIAMDYRSFRTFEDEPGVEELLQRICNDGIGLVSSESGNTTLDKEHKESDDDKNEKEKDDEL